MDATTDAGTTPPDAGTSLAPLSEYWSRACGKYSEAELNGATAPTGEQPLTLLQWCAQRCDCTEEHPCPLMCEGTVFDGFPTLVFGGCFPVSSREPACVNYFPRSTESCPQLTAEQAMLATDAPCPPDSRARCGSIEVITLPPLPSPTSMLRQHFHFDVETRRQIAWEFWDHSPNYPLPIRLCGGILPRDCPADAPAVSCNENPYALTCDCPPSACTAPPCKLYTACTSAADCASGVCDGLCRSAPTCTNGVQDGTETDVDCGGTSCHPCWAGRACASADDCRNGGCDAGKCGPATCFNGQRDSAFGPEGETGLDCGGTLCPPCVDGGAP